MAILTLICPKCEKTAYIDYEDNESYCLHCGHHFTPEERAEADSSGLYELIESIDYYDANIERFSKKPWYDDMIGFRTVLFEEGPVKAAKVFDDLMASNKEDISIAECATAIIVDWTMTEVDAPSGYNGGVLDLIEVLCKYTGEKPYDVMSPMLSVLLASFAHASDSAEGLVKDMGSALMLMMESMRCAYDIIGVLEMCIDYIRFTDSCVEAIDSLIEDDAVLAEHAEHIDALRDFVKVIGDTISDASSDESAVDDAVAAWIEADKIDHGNDIMAFTKEFLGGSSDSAALKPLVDSYISSYMSHSA